MLFTNNVKGELLNNTLFKENISFSHLPGWLRGNRHITLCKFKVYNGFIW